MELIGQKRQKLGKVVKSLRREGLIPAVVSGNEIDPTAIVLNRMDFAKLFAKTGETSLIDLKIENLSYKVLVKDVQYNPVTGQIIHAAFYKPNLKEKTEVAVPVKVVGEENNELVKSGEAVVLQLMNEINVKALPSDLPDHFIVDVTALDKVGASVTIGQLEYDHNKVEIMDLEADELVVKLDNAVMAEEPEEVAEVTEADVIAGIEASAEKKPEEGEESEEDEPKAKGKE